jgi:hypothetical protein
MVTYHYVQFYVSIIINILVKRIFGYYLQHYDVMTSAHIIDQLLRYCIKPFTPLKTFLISCILIVKSPKQSLGDLLFLLGFLFIVAIIYMYISNLILKLCLFFVFYQLLYPFNDDKMGAFSCKFQ